MQVASWFNWRKSMALGGRGSFDKEGLQIVAGRAGEEDVGEIAVAPLNPRLAEESSEKLTGATHEWEAC
jgi:hypothetical protein